MYQYHFLIPDPHSFPSGGNVYNACLVQALTDAGIHISHGPFMKDVLLDSPDTIYVLDSIYFPQIRKPAWQIPRRCIGLIHHLESLYPVSESVFRDSEKPLLDCFAAFLVTSSFTARYLITHGYDAQRICLIEPGPTLQRKPRSELPEPVHALMLGSFVPRKGQFAFLGTLADTNIPPQYTITMAGSLTADTAYATACRDQIRANPHLQKCINMIGEQEASMIDKLYQHANLFLSASAMETFGMAIQDAVVSGIPVIALEGGYAAQHISDGINGYRCQTMDELISQFGLCIGDPAHFLTLRQRAGHFSPNYQSWADAAESFISFFTDENRTQ